MAVGDGTPLLLHLAADPGEDVVADAPQLAAGRPGVHLEHRRALQVVQIVEGVGDGRSAGDHAVRGQHQDRLAVHLRRHASSSANRSEEHTSELQSLMRISYAVFCLHKKNTIPTITPSTNNNTYSHTSTTNRILQTHSIPK